MKPGLHRHKCGYVDDLYNPHAGCGHEWGHENACALLPSAQFDKAHTCPQCGKKGWVAKLPEPGKKRNSIAELFNLLDELEGK